MALIGGSRGGQNLFWGSLNSYAGEAIKLLNSSNSTYTAALATTGYSKAEALSLIESLATQPPIPVFQGLASQGLNFRDQINPGDASQTPLQFSAPAVAECRVFYLADDIVNVTNTWKRLGSGDFVCADGGKLGKPNPGLPYGSTGYSSDATRPESAMRIVAFALITIIVLFP
jgi:hypothetical protein